MGNYYLGISSVGNESYKIDGTGAASGSGTGDYVVQLQLFNPDPNGTLQGAVPVDLTEPTETLQDNTGNSYTDVLQTGELGSDPPPTGSTTRIAVPTDVDMFQVTAPDDGTLSLDAVSSVFSGDQTYLAVFDSSQRLIDSASSTSLLTGDNTLSVAVSSGQTYYVAVTVPQNSNFNPSNPYVGRVQYANNSNQNYDLHLRFDNRDVNGTALNATNATLGNTVSAKVGSDNGSTVGNAGAKDVDWYTYTANQNGLFDVTAQSSTSGFTPVITLWEYTQGQSDIVKVADTSSSSLFASPASLVSPAAITPPSGSVNLIDQVSAGQTFFVAITGQGNSNFNWYAVASGTGGQTGNYTLSTSLQPLANLATLSDNAINNGTPQPISVGQSVKGNIGSDGSLVVGASDVDLYKLVADTTETLNIRTFTGQEGDADTVLRVFDASGNPIASNDNIDATTTASQVTVSVQKGQSYFIGVDGAGTSSMAYDPLTGANAGSGSTGNYALSVAATAPGFSVAAPAPVAAYAGGAIVFTVTLDQALAAPATVDYATSDGTAIAGTDYSAASGTLTFPAGVTVESVRVPVLVNSGAQGNRSFTLTLSSPAGAQIADATATATATIEDVPVSTLNFSAGKPASYTDSAGRRVQLAIVGAGTGTAVFVNDAADPSQISLDGTVGSSLFTVRGAGAAVGDILVNGSLFSLSAKSVALNGSLNVSGSLAKLALGNVTGGASGGIIATGANSTPMIVSLGRVSNESFSTPGPIASLKVNEWLNSGGASVSLSAASIGSIASQGDFGASVTAQALGNFKVAGSLTSGSWSIAGSGANLSVHGSATPAWSATFGGTLNQVRLGSAAGSLTASSIASLKVTGKHVRRGR